MSYLSEILSSAEEVEIEHINSKLPEIVSSVDSCKNNILTYLESVYVRFLERPKRNKLLADKISTLQNEINTLMNSVESVLKRDLNKVESDMKKYLESLTKLKFSVELLNNLYEIHQKLITVRELKGTPSYLCCIKEIIAAESCIDNTLPSKLLALEELSLALSMEKNSLIDNMYDMFRDKVNLKTTENCSIFQIRNESNVINDILLALYLYNTSVAPLDDVTRFLWNNVFVPIVDCTTEVKTNIEDHFLIMEVITTDSTKKMSYAEVFANIKMVVNFLSNFNIQLDENLTTLSYIGRDLGDNLAELIVKHCLQDTVPTSTEDLKKYSVVIEATEDLQKILIQSYIFTEDTNSIVEYARNIDVLFAHKKHQNYIMQAQTIMKKDLHDLVEVGVVPDMQNSLETTTDFPHCSVSSSVTELLGMLENILIEVISSSEACARSLLNTIRTICQNYIKFVPEYHKKLLQTIPQQVAVFYNNCMYISHKLTEWDVNYSKKLLLLFNTECIFKDEGSQLEQVASNMFTNFVVEQMKQIEEIMKESDLQQSTIERLENMTEKCLRQCLRQQELLKTVWHKVLPYTVYNKTVGTILNSLCNYVVDAIVKSEDISADAAEQLVELLKMIQTRGPKLFTDSREVPLFVGSWYRLNELAFVLNASLLDINDRWADGKGPLALQFKNEEIKQLIRALFQNTERRAALLAKIHD